MFSAPSLTELIDGDGDSEEMDHAHHTPTQNGGRIMYLKLKKARLESQVAFTRTQLQLAEMELRLMELDLQNEVQKTAMPTPEPKAPRPQTKRPHKFVKLLSKVLFKPSGSKKNTEEPDTTDPTPQVKEDLAMKRKIVEATERSKKARKIGSDKEFKENRNTSRSNNKPQVEQEVDNSKKDKKEKEKSSNKKKKTVETETKGKTEIKETKEKAEIKETKATEKKHSDSNNKDKVTKGPQAKHSSKQNKNEKAKGKDDKNSKVDKGLKSILKKSCVTEEMNNNVIENISPENTGEYEGTVELNIRKMFNNRNSKLEATTVDKGTSMDSTGVQTDVFPEIRENVVIKDTFFKKSESDVVKVVDAMLCSLQNDQLFTELRNIKVKTEKGSSLGSMETLVLDEGEDRKMELFM